MATSKLENLDLTTLAETGLKSIQGTEEEAEQADKAGDLEFAKDPSEESAPSDDTKSETSDEDADKKTEDPDYKALFEASEARAKTLENKAKTQEGRNKVQGKRDADIEELKRAQEATNKMVAAFVSASAPGSDVDLGQEIGKIQSDQATEVARSAIQAQFQTMSEALAHASHSEGTDDDEGVLLLTKSQVEAIRVEWQAGKDAWIASGYRDPFGLTNTVLSASRMALETERANQKTKENTDKTEKAKAKKDAQEESGEGELDIGPGQARASADLEDMSARDLINMGLAGEKQSRIFEPGR